MSTSAPAADHGTLAYVVLGGVGAPVEGHDAAGRAYSICHPTVVATICDITEGPFRRRTDNGGVPAVSTVPHYLPAELPDGWPDVAPSLVFSVDAVQAAAAAIVTAADGLQLPQVLGERAARVLAVRALPAGAAALTGQPSQLGLAYIVVDDAHTGFPAEGTDGDGRIYAICSSGSVGMLRELNDPGFCTRWELQGIELVDVVVQYHRDELPAGWPAAAPMHFDRAATDAATAAAAAVSADLELGLDERGVRRVVARALAAAGAVTEHEISEEVTSDG